MPHAHDASYNVTPVNPAALPGQVDGKEYKYERVETTKVDDDGTAYLVDAREDRGKEDPGMNFQDMRPNVPAGTPIGVMPSAISGVAPLQPVHPIPGPFVSGEKVVVGMDNVNMYRADSYEPASVIQETTMIKEKNVIRS